MSLLNLTPNSLEPFKDLGDAYDSGTKKYFELTKNQFCNRWKLKNGFFSSFAKHENIKLYNNESLVLSNGWNVDDSIFKGFFDFNWENNSYKLYIEASEWSSCDYEIIHLISASNEHLEEFKKAFKTYYYINHTEYSGSWEYREKHTGYTWADLHYKEEDKKSLITEIDNFLTGKSRIFYEKTHQVFKKGLLFAGPQGTGKSTVGKILDSVYPDIPLIYVTSLSISMDDGESGSSFSRIYNRAKKSTPSIVWFEDLDGLMESPGYRTGFLSALDGLNDNDGVLTIATTNHPEKIDPALIQRPSRFDRVYLFPNPSLSQRTMYIRSILNELDSYLKPEVVEKLSKLTAGLSFSHLKEIFLAAFVNGLGDEQAIFNEADRLVKNADAEFMAKLVKQFDVNQQKSVGFRSKD